MKKIKAKIASVMTALAVTVVLSASFISCGGKKADSDFVFKIGTANSGLCGAPLHIAIDKGIFEEEFGKAGLKYETIEIDIQQASALAVAKKIDASLGLAGSLVPQMDNGLEISFLTGVHTGCTKFYVRSDSPYNTVSDLKGKTVGFCGVQDSSTIAFQRKFFDYGHIPFGPDAEFKIAVYGMTDLPIALSNGAVEAVGLHDPIAYIAERDYGFKKILDTTEDEKFSQEYCCLTFVSSDIAKKYPEHTKAFVRAVLKASAYVQAKPVESAQLQLDNKQMTGDLEQNALLLSTYNYTPSVGLAKKTVHDSISQLVEMGVMQNVKDENKFVEEHFVSFDDVPDSYIYNSDGTYTETKITKLAQK
ncbi:ABC transporter substrate-binding protein [Treponema sp.]|uniref:ABC transporter substrate-binding protein n=1 Tax=Treponema sp. TaxID=166 RepID=UPI00388F00AE